MFFFVDGEGGVVKVLEQIKGGESYPCISGQGRPPSPNTELYFLGDVISYVSYHILGSSTS